MEFILVAIVIGINCIGAHYVNLWTIQFNSIQKKIKQKEKNVYFLLHRKVECGNQHPRETVDYVNYLYYKYVMLKSPEARKLKN